MYVTTFTHFLDTMGNIPLEMPKEARTMASFLSIIVEEATVNNSEVTFETNINCLNPECNGMINTEFIEDDHGIYWECPKCDQEGMILDWQHTKWDKTNKKISDQDRQILNDFFNNSLAEGDKDVFIKKGSSEREFVLELIKRLEKSIET